jgi:hypothetical protein
VHAPNFTLQSLTGGVRSLSGWHGRPLLLIFIKPGCPYSRRLLPVIAGLPPDPPPDRPVPVVIAFGLDTVNRRMVKKYGIRCPVLLQCDMEISQALRVLRTPTSCLIDEDGRVAGDYGVGEAGVLAHLGVTPGPGCSTETTSYSSAAQQLLPLIRRQKKEVGGRLKHRVSPENRATGPLVSVILTTRDRPRMLSIALECYRRQTYPNRELIVVDDGGAFPVDETKIVAVGGRVIRVPEGTPLGAKLNRGASEARGSLCQKWDDDDWYAPRYLETMVSALPGSIDDLHGPVVAFQLRSLWFDLARWRVFDSPEDWPSGATLLFSRAGWRERPFRDISHSEDDWFVLEHMSAGLPTVIVPSDETYMYVRHALPGKEKGHTWTRLRAQNVEQHLRKVAVASQDPSRILPRWALSTYRDLRGEQSATGWSMRRLLMALSRKPPVGSASST